MNTSVENNKSRVHPFVVVNTKSVVKKSKLRKSHNFLIKVGSNTKSKKQSLHEHNSRIMEKEIIKEATAELRYMVRKNGEFLVTPDISKRLNVDLRNKKRIVD